MVCAVGVAVGGVSLYPPLSPLRTPTLYLICIESLLRCSQLQVVCLLVRRSECLYLHLSVHLSAYLSFIYLLSTIYLSVHPSIRLAVHHSSLCFCCVCLSSRMHVHCCVSPTYLGDVPHEICKVKVYCVLLPPLYSSGMSVLLPPPCTTVVCQSSYPPPLYSSGVSVLLTPPVLQWCVSPPTSPPHIAVVCQSSYLTPPRTTVVCQSSYLPLYYSGVSVLLPPPVLQWCVSPPTSPCTTVVCQSSYLPLYYSGVSVLLPPPVLQWYVSNFLKI